MDFSTDTRALHSLIQRKPPIENKEVLDVSKSLLDFAHSEEIDSIDYSSKILLLTNLGVEGRWEALAVGLFMSINYLTALADIFNQEKGSLKSHIYPEGPRVPDYAATDPDAVEITTENIDLVGLSNFCQSLTDICISQLEHSEPRIRTLIAKFVAVHGTLIAACTNSSDPAEERFMTALIPMRAAMYERITSSLFAHLVAGREVNTLDSKYGSQVALDDTTGWKALETSLHALAAYSDAPFLTFTGSDDDIDIDMLIEALEHCAANHINRHVRAASLQAIERLISNHFSANQILSGLIQPRISNVLSITLSDNWSQVRMAASTLCRTLFEVLLRNDCTQEDLQVFYPDLLPRMCLNRFYLAQGVKIYSQKTWEIILGNKGIETVANNIGRVAKYYVECCDADNHVVREAACQAVAELAKKVGSHPEFATQLEPFVPMLLQALLMCFHDESWPVRDEACTACGTFAKAYPSVAETELPLLYSRWTEQVTDQIWSVREGAAIALSDAMCAYGKDFQRKLINLMHELLPGAKDEPPMSMEEYKARQNDINAHTNSQLYSCGSLAPKLKKGGCSDCIVTRPKAPWERTDGAIYLLREICVNKEVPIDDSDLMPLMVELVDAVRVKHFPQADDLRATLWKCLPVMAKGLGKKRFKGKYLNMFLDSMVNSLERGNPASQHAASLCAKELGTLVGNMIFMGRVREVVGDSGEQIVESCLAHSGEETGARVPGASSMWSNSSNPTIASSNTRWGEESEAF